MPVNLPDDAAAFLARSGNGSHTTFEATRYARGDNAEHTFEINGENASIAWNPRDLHRLNYFDYGGCAARRSLHVTDGHHPSMKRWWCRPSRSAVSTHSFTRSPTSCKVSRETSRQAPVSETRWRPTS
jgi:hypothetical protein